MPIRDEPAGAVLESESSSEETSESEDHEEDRLTSAGHPMLMARPPTNSTIGSGHIVHASSASTEILLRNLPGSTDTISPSAYALPPASLAFTDLSFSLPQKKSWRQCLWKSKKEERPKKLVLAPCHGYFEPGTLTALMGPSGSGKTTLLDMLAMKKTAPYEGDIFVNGWPRDTRLFRRIAAYVGQEDLMPSHWKVREAIKFNATLKYTEVRSHWNVDAWVDVLLDVFDLTSVSESLIGGTEVRGISGGQRRRVTLARGVAAHASLLFCDEPTSGLSATDAERCIRALRSICKRLCVTCIVVIHQPRTEVAELFDRLLLLSSHPGRMVFFGNMDEAEVYWQQIGLPVPKNVNPTDYYMDTVTPGTRQDASKLLVAAFNEHQCPALRSCVGKQSLVKGMTCRDMLTNSSGGQADVEESSFRSGYDGKKIKRHSVGFCSQFCILLKRKLRLTVRNPMALALPICVPVIQGMIVGWMFQGTGQKHIDRQVMFAFCMLTMLCLAGTMGLIVLINDRILMKHEVSEQLYSEVAWAISTQAVDVPLALAGALINIAIMLAFGQIETSLGHTILVWSLLLFFVYDSLFSFIAAVAVDTRQAQVLASPCVSIFMLFNGFVVTRADAPSVLTWIFDISPNAYAMEAIVAKIAADSDDGLAGAMIVSAFDIDNYDPRRGMVVMVSMIVVLRIGQMLGLRYLNHIQR